MHKHRLYEVDILRGMTFLAIVVQHVLAVFLYSPRLTTADALVSAIVLVFIRYAVPMFILITGLVLFYNHGEGDFHYGTFLRKRFTQIFIPYAIWTLIYYLWSGIFPGSASGLLADWGRLILSGEACYHLWFMVAIMQFYLLFPFFRWLLLRFKKNPGLVLTVGFLAYVGLMWFNTDGAPALYAQTANPWLKTLLAYRDRLFISWFFYFILGGYAGIHARKLRIVLRYMQKRNIFIYLLSFLLVVGAVIGTGKISSTGAYQYNFLFTLPLTPLMVVYLTSSLLTIYYWALKYFRKDHLFTRLMKTFGRYSYGCYFVHAMLLSYCTALLNTYWPGITPLAFLAAAFAACSASSLAACYLMSLIQIPAGNLLVGRIPKS